MCNKLKLLKHAWAIFTGLRESCAHPQMVHMDIKSANVLLQDKTCRVAKIADLGISRYLMEGSVLDYTLRGAPDAVFVLCNVVNSATEVLRADLQDCKNVSCRPVGLQEPRALCCIAVAGLASALQQSNLCSCCARHASLHVARAGYRPGRSADGKNRRVQARA